MSHAERTKSVSTAAKAASPDYRTEAIPQSTGQVFPPIVVGRIEICGQFDDALRSTKGSVHASGRTVLSQKLACVYLDTAVSCSRSKIAEVGPTEGSCDGPELTSVVETSCSSVAAAKKEQKSLRQVGTVPAS